MPADADRRMRGLGREVGMDATSDSVGSRPWDGFIVGPENAFAQAAVLALARGDESVSSPLVIHGASGSGKSRLLEGLVAEFISRRPASVVAHLAAEAFAGLCAQATGESWAWSELRDRFRTIDLFVLDDLHHLVRAPLALGELAYTLDALDYAGASVAVSARTAPAEWTGWPSRLRSRLAAGLTVRVEPPGLDSRRRYLFEHARLRGLTLPADAVEALAEAADGYRTLDGLLSRLALDVQLERGRLDGRLVQSALAEEGTIAPHLTIEVVTKTVASRFGCGVGELRSTSRRSSLVETRHLAILLSRRWTGSSYASIGKFFGGRDPATVRYACRMAADRLARDPGLAATVTALEARWGRTEIDRASTA
jgi:chromosomal replication initiator protein